MRRNLAAAAAFVLMVASARPAAAQQPLTEVLSFLLINRSIPTGDFERDELAAAATRDAIVGLLRAELATLPINSPASGFTYRLDPAIGANVRTSDSFGAFFIERSLTGGRQIAVGLGYTHASFGSIDGRNLRNGTLAATASRLEGDAQPFDVETLTLRISTQTLTLSGHVGLTDRLDVSAAVPFVRLTLTGERIDTYRGDALLQASAEAQSSGIGDVIVRAKYNVFRSGGSGVSVAGEARLPTGDADNLLGGGESIITPRLIGSMERGRIAVHGSLGYSMGGGSEEVNYGGAVTLVGTPRLTIIGEIVGRRLNSGGRLTDVTEPHPTLVGVETIRLSATTQPTNRALFVAGFRWNVATRWLLSANVLRPMTSAGLNARWVTSVMIDYTLGG